MPAGRPRTVSLEPDEMISLGEEMIAFVQNKKNNIYHLSEWYTIEKMFTYNEWDTMSKRPEFVPYYEKALKIVAKRYINGDIAPAIANRFLRLYFKDMKDGEDRDADAEAERKAKALKGEVRAAEEEKQKVLKEVQRNRRTIK